MTAAGGGVGGAATRVTGPGPPGPRHWWRTAMLADLLARAAPSGPLLDAGCGRGTMSLRLAAMGRQVFACDLVPRWARVAEASGSPGPRWVCADLMRLPYPTGTLAGIGAGEVLEHLDDDVAAVAEWARVLAPGGVLAVTVPAGSDRMSAFDRRVGHHRRYSRSQLADVLTAAGLTAEKVTGWGWPFGRMYDRFVQQPGLGAFGLANRAGGAPSPSAWRPLQLLFALESRWDARDAGSGLVAVARKP